MTIVPDTKDWTWVLQRPCPECGLDTQGFPRDAIAGMIRTNAAAWQDALTGPGDARRRPAPGTWSALEYGCHVRDVLRLYDERLRLMLTEDGPCTPTGIRMPPRWPTATASRIPPWWPLNWPKPAKTIAAGFESVTGGQWQRTGRRSDGAHFTVETFARYFIHDPVHHLYDVTRAR